MALNNVKFNRTNGLGQLAAGSDYVSGLLFYSDTLPAGFTTDDRVKKIFNVQGAEDLGITDDWADETVATTGGTIEVTGVGAAGDTITVKLDSVLLGSYTEQTADGVNDIASGIAAAINALSNDHGFTAEAVTATVTITAPDGLGIIPNGATLAFASSGAATATVTQFSAGAGSFKRVMHYHISEFFRMKPDGVLYVGIYAVPDSFDGTEITSMQNTADGEMRQVGVYYPNASFASSQVSAIQTQLAALRLANKQLFAIFHANCFSLALADLPDLSALTASKVNVNISEDGNWFATAYSATQTYNPGDKFTWLNKTYICGRTATGKAPYNSDYFSVVSENIRLQLGYSISTLGNELGTIANNEVHQSIANPERNNVASGNNLDVAGFATGVTYKAQASSLLDTLDTYHYTFLRKFERNAGTYYNNDYTCIADTSDYNNVRANRTMDKAERLVYDSFVPKIASELNLKSDGTLTQTTIQVFEAAGEGALDSMANNISVDDDGNAMYSLVVPPSQNVLSTSKLECTLQLVPKGVANNILVNNSFVVSL